MVLISPKADRKKRISVFFIENKSYLYISCISLEMISWKTWIIHFCLTSCYTSVLCLRNVAFWQFLFQFLCLCPCLNDWNFLSVSENFLLRLEVIQGTLRLEILNSALRKWRLLVWEVNHSDIFTQCLALVSSRATFELSKKFLLFWIRSPSEFQCNLGYRVLSNTCIYACSISAVQIT